MTRTATLTLSRNDEREITLGQFDYRLQDQGEHTVAVSVLSAAVTLPGSGEAVRVESACAEPYGNTSFAIFFAGEQILLVGCQWNQVPPHIGVRLPIVDTWLHVYCLAT